ncbi:pepF/M3 family oligoendopeptidase [Ilumatobacter fluminis]|uniref:PepF/M3 family oligoendopeptidase n=1 Tax=Ilumatobacter fluminis TaxID=467091 RepID=A0A4R7I2J9_9ACTN|nr:M3 family oligoendopeptidase [Ilumatobacter fluminis]TDT16763.1 pepF/M3 family oligoendopeptidase [Ilumatobacter fluminis]
MTLTDDSTRTGDTELPRWSVADVYPSLDDRSFTDAMETLDADVTRLIALFDEHDIRQTDPRAPTAADGQAADVALRMFNEVSALMSELGVATLSVTATDSRDDAARALMSRVEQQSSRLTPLLARLAEWVHALGVEPLAGLSTEVAEHVGPLTRLDERVAHQMTEREEELYAELSTTGSSAWRSLQQVVTSQLAADVAMPDGSTEHMPINAVRGLATHADPAMRRAGYEAELQTWPQVATTVAAAMNAIKGEAVIVNRRRHWDDPIDASLYANSVSRPTYEAMQSAVTASLPDWRRWMRAKARLHGHDGGLPWWDLVAPAPTGDTTLSWDDGIDWVRSAFGSYSTELGGLVDRALDERWIDAPPADGKTGGAFCASFRDDRSLVLLNWSGSIDSAQTTAHELGHAYHNVTLAGRTPLQRRLPMALAETASIFCETLAIEQRLGVTTDPNERLGLLDVSLTGPNQVVVDIQSRLQFETEVFERRRRGTLGASELDEMMLRAQADTYGDGIDLDTRHPYMWLLKPHYYGSHFYNWPYTYGLLFGLGLYAAYRDDPERFRLGYDDLLSRAGMDTAEVLGARFDLDVTDEAFWTSSLDVLRARMTEYERLVDAR